MKKFLILFLSLNSLIVCSQVNFEASVSKSKLALNERLRVDFVMIGEIGGQLETDAAKWVAKNGNKKPIVGFIAGETAPKGRTMGHAGAIVGGAEDTAEAKKKAIFAP